MPTPTVYGWVTETEADTYFSERPGSSAYWISGADKVASLQFAYKVLTNSRRFSFPSTATQVMKDAQCEMTLFLIMHMPDIDIRMGLRAQGILNTGILREQYSDRIDGGFPIPPFVSDMLLDYDQQRSFYSTEIERDEEQGVDYDAFGNLEREE